MIKSHFIENFNEIEPVLIKNGYEIIDTQKMDYIEQVKLFSSCIKIIAIHGAGLVNLIHLPQNASLIEIMPENRMASQYYRLSKIMNINYNIFIGEKLQSVRIYPESGFLINKNKFFNKLNIRNYG